MAESWYRNRAFICTNEQCPCSKDTEKRYKWSDDEKPEVCKSCQSEMIEYFEEVGEAGAYLKFNSLSKEDKRTLLKKRSNDHFKKEIAERKHQQSEKFYKEMRNLRG